MIGQHERAAAVALFNNKIREAIEILSSQRAHNNMGSKGEKDKLITVKLYVWPPYMRDYHIWNPAIRPPHHYIHASYKMQIYSTSTQVTQNPDNFSFCP